jgi:hypothetical protein
MKNILRALRRALRAGIDEFHRARELQRTAVRFGGEADTF